MLREIILEGYIAKRPEVKRIEKNDKTVTICNYDIGVQRDYKDSSGSRKSDFFHCNAYNGMAEFASKYFSVGDLVSIMGSPEFSIGIDKNTGEKVRFFNVQVKKQSLLKKKNNEGDGWNSVETDIPDEFIDYPEMSEDGSEPL